MARSPIAALLSADTARAAAEVRGAAVRFLPTLQASFTEASPQYHVIGELPLDGAVLRGRRLTVARALQQSVRRQFAFNRAALTFDIDTAYTRALAAAARAGLSTRTAIDADSLLHIAEARRDAGDASELDVQLAVISAGQQANTAAVDSLDAMRALLDVQTLIGERADSITVMLVDSLAVPADRGALTTVPTPLRVAAAKSLVMAADAQVVLEKRQRFGVPSLTAGFERGDPTGAQTYLLPTVGVALPIPFPGRNRAQVEIAEVERARAIAALRLTSLESQRQIARAERERLAASSRVERDSRLLTTAERVAAMAMTAYREGAVPLPGVIEARRNARDVQLQYINDLAALWTAIAAQRLVTEVDHP
ncbi:MAG: TolC family protein [Polaromonas sp.]|nr:TolC family protein [Gemmatimonadaceae bacterium]